MLKFSNRELTFGDFVDYGLAIQGDNAALLRLLVRRGDTNEEYLRSLSYREVTEMIQPLFKSMSEALSLSKLSEQIEQE